MDAGHKSLVQAVETHLRSIGQVAPEGLAGMTNEKLMEMLPRVETWIPLDVEGVVWPDGSMPTHRRRATTFKWHGR